MPSKAFLKDTEGSLDILYLIFSIMLSASISFLKVLLNNSFVSKLKSNCALLLSKSSLIRVSTGINELENSQNPSLMSLSVSYLSMYIFTSSSSHTTPNLSNPILNSSSESLD